MTDARIVPEKVTRPFQMLAAWLSGLVIVDATFLAAASQIHVPSWVPATLVLASVANVPLFLISIFLLQTRFRPEMQEDSFYSKYLERKFANVEVSGAVLDLAPSQASSLSYRIAVVIRTNVLSDADIQAGFKALQTQVHRDLAPTWGVDAALTYVGRDDVAPAGSWRLEIADESSSPGMLAGHDITPDGLPQAQVNVKMALEVGHSWTVVASHELLEMLVNPRNNVLGVLVEGRGKPRMYAYQIADPCSSDHLAYSIDGVKVSDFVFPAWFEPAREPGTRFDFSQHLKAPLEIGPGCYATVYEVGGRGQWKSIFADTDK